MVAAVTPLAAMLALGLSTIAPAPVPASTTTTASPSTTSLCGVGPALTSGSATAGGATSCATSGAGQAGDTVPPASLMPHSLFNRDVASWPVARDSGTIVAQFNRDWRENYGSVGVNGRPVVWVPADQPMVPLLVQHGCRSFQADTGTSAPIPPWAPTGGNTDYILTVYQPSRDAVWEFWQARRVTIGKNSGDGSSRGAHVGWSACSAGKATLNTFSGIFPSPFGETATGISNLATEVTEADVLSGSIDHAIGMQVVDCTTFTYPANRGDCNYDPGTPAEGQWFRFAPGVNCADYESTPFEHEVCLAGKQYGFVVVDQGGSVGIEADYATGTWNDEGNPGPMISWQRNANGQCCIFAGGGGPLEESFKSTADNYEQAYQVIVGLPWDRLQVMVPPRR